VRNGVLEVDSYFEQSPGAAGVLGAPADQEITSAMRQLGYGYPADAVAELVSVTDFLLLSRSFASAAQCERSLSLNT
jgi:hypothetical protein